MRKEAERIFARFFGSKFARNVLVLASGMAVGQALVILSSPVLTRLYGPENFGVLSVYVSCLTILAVVVSLRYQLAIPLPKDDETAANVLALSLMIVFGMSLLFGILLWLFGRKIVVFANIPAIEPYLWLLSVGSLGIGVYQSFNYWAIRKRAFNRISQTRVNQSLGLVFTQMGMGFLNLGSIGLLLGDVIGRASGTGTLATLAFRQDRKILHRVSSDGMWKAAIRYRRFPMISSTSGLLNTAGGALPALLIAGLYGPQEAGWFALSQRVIGAPTSLVGQAVGQVYLSEVSRMLQKNDRGARRLFSRTTKKMFLLGVGPTGLLALSGQPLFELVFGSVWREAGWYAQVLSVMFILQFISRPVSVTLDILERQDLELLWDLMRLVLVVGGLVGVYKLGYSARIAIVTFTASMTIAYAVLLALINIVLIRHDKDLPDSK